MTDPIERRIAGLQLPQPTPELDRRIDALLAAPPAPGRNRRVGVLSAAAATLAAGFVGLVLGRAHAPGPVAETVRQPEPAVVESVEVVIPALELSPAAVLEQDRLLPDGTVVVSTTVQKEQMK